MISVAEFDRFRDSYERRLEDAVRFSGQDREFFTKAKARALVDLARRRVGDPPSLSALDVGCGVGLTVAELHGAFREVGGVDISQGMIERARERDPGGDYRVYSGTRLPYDDASFDVVFTICVLHHVPPSSRYAFMVELARVVKPGGLVVVGEHNPANPLTRFVVSRCAFDVDAELLPARESEVLLRYVGLSRIERRYILIAPFESPAVSRVERALQSVPVGAQYLVGGVKPAA